MKIRPATLALAAFLAACQTTTPPPSVSATPPATSTPSPSPIPAADLVAAATVRQGCGSIGGCAYFVNIDGVGESWKAEFGFDGQGDDLVAAEGLPSTIPAGTYTLTLSSVLVSDEIVNGVRQLGPTDASCSTTLNVRGDKPIRIEGTFDDGSCEVGVNG